MVRDMKTLRQQKNDAKYLQSAVAIYLQKVIETNFVKCPLSGNTL